MVEPQGLASPRLLGRQRLGQFRRDEDDEQRTDEKERQRERVEQHQRENAREHPRDLDADEPQSTRRRHMMAQRRHVVRGDRSSLAVRTDETHTKTIGANNYHYAGDYDGADADARLTNALAGANGDDTIYLENATYSTDRNLSSQYSFVGSQLGTRLEASWTLLGASRIRNIRLGSGQATSASLATNGYRVWFVNVSGYGNTTINNDVGILYGLWGENGNMSVTFASGTAKGIIDSSSRVAVTDNGTNTVGDIA